MSVSFDPDASLIYVKARVYSAKGIYSLLLALDLGASTTMISRKRLKRFGYDLSANSEKVRVITGSRVEFAQTITVEKLTAINQERIDFPVLAHDLPSEAGIDGVLGLDFFRKQNLNLDFRNGLITLT